MKSILQRFSKRVSRVVRSADSFGRPINLTYNKENKFKTYLGGSCSLIMHMGFLLYFIFLTIALMNKSSSNVSSNNINRGVLDDKSKHYFGKDDFVLSMGLTFHDHSLLGDYFRQYLDLSVQLVSYSFGENGEEFKEIRMLELEECGDNFPLETNVSKTRFHYDKFA